MAALISVRMQRLVLTQADLTRTCCVPSGNSRLTRTWPRGDASICKVPAGQAGPQNLSPESTCIQGLHGPRIPHVGPFGMRTAPWLHTSHHHATCSFLSLTGAAPEVARASAALGVDLQHACQDTPCHTYKPSTGSSSLATARLLSVLEQYSLM